MRNDPPAGKSFEEAWAVRFSIKCFQRVCPFLPCVWVAPCSPCCGNAIVMLVSLFFFFFLLCVPLENRRMEA